MSWRFPKFPLEDGMVPAVDDVNANFREVTDELGGKLNEQNFQKGAIARISEVEPDAAFVWHSARRGYIDFFGAATSGRHEIVLNSNWTDIDDCQMTVQAAEGALFILASFQVSKAYSDLGDQSHVVTLYGIKVDGLVIPESVIGTSEEMNDATGGVGYGAIALSTSIVIPMSSGSHSVSIVCRTLMPSDALSGHNTSIYLYNREIIALEMRR